MSFREDNYDRLLVCYEGQQLHNMVSPGRKDTQKVINISDLKPSAKHFSLSIWF